MDSPGETLTKAHDEICRAAGLLVIMVIQRKVWKSYIRLALPKLKSAVSKLESILGEEDERSAN